MACSLPQEAAARRHDPQPLSALGYSVSVEVRDRVRAGVLHEAGQLGPRHRNPGDLGGRPPPRRRAQLGGTDGSRLSEMGLPTPNIFAGGHEFHSPREWVSVQDMAAATAVIVRLAAEWAE